MALFSIHEKNMHCYVAYPVTKGPDVHYDKGGQLFWLAGRAASLVSSKSINFFNYLLEGFAGRKKVRRGPQFAHPCTTR